jgi:hypothetical protein
MSTVLVTVDRHCTSILLLEVLDSILDPEIGYSDIYVCSYITAFLIPESILTDSKVSELVSCSCLTYVIERSGRSDLDW